MWSGPKGASVQERLDRAQDAKKSLLERFRKQPGPGDQEYEERRRVAEQILLILREAGHSCVLAEDADLRLPGRLLS